MSQGNYDHLYSAPKRLLDLRYCIGVAKGRIEPDEDALPLVDPAFAISAEDIMDARHAFGCGFGQGWDCEIGGRIYKVTPPKGLPMGLLLHFCEGALAGADNVATAREASQGGSVHDFDPFSDIDHDL